MNTIVTHLSPDLDAITSCWLIQRFMKGWDDATVAFVPAGNTLEGKPADEDPTILHVDTGLGMFDHHQTSDRTSAAKRVFDHLQKEAAIPNDIVAAIDHLVSYVVDIDHFGEINYPEPNAERYIYQLPNLIDGMNVTLHNDTQVLEITYKLLDATVQLLKNRLKAEEELKKGFTLTTKFGKTIALESKNEEVMKLALKSGYALVVRKDPERGFLRLKSRPDPKIDLTPVYEALQKADPQASWFLHASKNMLLNGSSKNPQAVPSQLSIGAVVEILRKI